MTAGCRSPSIMGPKFREEILACLVGNLDRTEKEEDKETIGNTARKCWGLGNRRHLWTRNLAVA